MAFLVGLFIWLKEFAELEGPPHWIYDKVAFGFRRVDLLILGVTWLVFFARLGTGTLTIPRFKSK